MANWLKPIYINNTNPSKNRDGFWDTYKEGWDVILGWFKPKKKESKPKEIKDKNIKVDTGSLKDMLNVLPGGLSGGGGYYSGGGTRAIDLQPMKDAYNKAAASQRADVETSIANSKSALLDSLKRFQEDTDKARKQQTASYNSARADLEESNFMNNRSAIQSAAARGLGGSGLQQLAQLQNQISAGKETSNLANANISAQNDLAEALQRQEQDTTKGVQQLETTRQNQLNEIDANLASNLAQLEYNEQVRQAEAAAQAAAQSASLAASRDAQANELLQLLQAGIYEGNAIKTKGLQDIQKAYESSKNSTKRKQAVKDAYNATQNALNQSYINYLLPQSYQDQFNDLLNSYYNNYYK